MLAGDMVRFSQVEKPHRGGRIVFEAMTIEGSTVMAWGYYGMKNTRLGNRFLLRRISTMFHGLQTIGFKVSIVPRSKGQLLESGPR